MILHKKHNTNNNLSISSYKYLAINRNYIYLCESKRMNLYDSLNYNRPHWIKGAEAEKAYE